MDTHLINFDANDYTLVSQQVDELALAVHSGVEKCLFEQDSAADILTNA